MQLPFNRLLFAIFMAFSSISFSQESSPYSRFGLGNIQDLNNIASSCMGGLGSSFRNTESISFLNPASYSALRLTGFEIATTATTSFLKTKEGDELNKATTFKGNLSYLSLSLPINKFWGTSVGLIPFSVKDYVIRDTFITEDTLGSRLIYEGSGGMYSAYFGNGFRIKDFSVGFNVGYLFGGLENYVMATPLDSSDAVDPYGNTSVNINNLRVHGFNWNIGVQYDARITKSVNLVIGLSGNAGTKLSSRNELRGGFFTVPNSFVTKYKTDNENIADFLQIINGAGLDTISLINQNISLKQPSTINFGFTFQEKSTWKAGFDFRYQVWSKYENYETSSVAKFSNSWRVGFGGEWLPKSSTQKTKFLERVRYRGGLYAQNTNLEINGQAIKEFGASIGFGLPMAASLSDDNGFIQRYLLHPFNIGFEAGTRGTTDNGLLKENFFRVKFGLTISDKWFVKRKYL